MVLSFPCSSGSWMIFSVASWHSFALLAGLEAVCQDYSLFLGQIYWRRGRICNFLQNHVCIGLVTCFNLREGWSAAERGTSAQALHHCSCGGDVGEQKPLSKETTQVQPPLQHRPTDMYVLTCCETTLEIRNQSWALHTSVTSSHPSPLYLTESLLLLPLNHPLNCLTGGAEVQVPLDSCLCACVLYQFSLFLSCIFSFM